MISILYVDDETDFFEVAKLFLEESGEFRVRTATSAKDALALPDFSSFDTIISDYQMPGMDGIAFLKEVRERFGDIPFILFTGRGREEVVIEAINNGADFYLQKGGDPEAQFAELAHKIRQVVRRKQTERSFHDMERRLSDIIDFLPDATFAIDRSGHVIAWNRAMKDMTGISPEVMLGKGDYEYAIPFYGKRCSMLIDLVFSPEDEVRQRYSFVRADKGILTAETINATPAGDPCILWGKAAPLFDSQGAVVGAIESIRDITELKKTGQELQSQFDHLTESDRMLRINEERLVMAQEIGQIGSWEYDLETKKIWGSAEGLHIFGYPPVAGDFPVADIEACIPERERVHQELVNLITKGQEYNLEYTINPADNSAPKVVHSVARLERDAGGNPFKVRGVIQDITERKRADDTLRESENKFSTIFKNSPVALTLVSAVDGTMVDVNNAFLRNTGYARHEVIGNVAAALQIFADRKEYKLFTSAIRNQRPIREMEIKCRIKTGEIRVCRFSSGIIMMGGRPHILSTIDDITERKKAEAALRESEEKFRRIADNAPDIIYRMSIPDRKFEYISPASVTLTGYSPEEYYTDSTLVGKMIHPAWKEYFRRQWEALLKKNVPPAYEYQIIDRSGKTRWFNQRNMLVTDDQGNPVAIEGIVTDTTRQKNTEQELRRNELRSHAVSENIGYWIWEIDPDGVYRYSSPAVSHILGYRPEELVGKMHYYDLFDPSVKDELTTNVTATMKSREPFRDFPNLNRHRNGTPVLIRTSGTPVFDENGTFSGYCGVDEDITERTSRESAFQALVRSMVGTTGMNALRQITESVSSWLGVECVMVGEIQPDRETVKVRSMLLDGKEISDFMYRLARTPCANVERAGFCHYPDNAVQLFPDAKDIVELNIRGYVGTPLRNSEGTVVGILCALSRSSIAATPAMQEIMNIIAVKAAAEIERIQMERELLESRRMLAEAMDLAHLVYWEFDVASGMFTFDDQFYSLYGTTAEREGGNLMPADVYAREFVHPDDRHLVGEEVERAMTTTDPSYTARIEHRIIRRDGTVRHIVVRIAISKDAKGQTIKTHGANQDITEIKLAEEAVRESEAKYRLLAENVHDVIWTADMDMHLTYISPSVTALTGLTVEEAMAGSLNDAVTPGSIEVMMRERELGLESLKDHDDLSTSLMELEFYRKNGSTVWTETVITLAFDSNRRPAGVVGVSRDITERKRIEEDLKESEEKFRSLVETTPGIIWEIDHEGRFQYISPMVKEILGYDPDELIGKPYKELVPEQLRPIVMQTFASLISYPGGPIQPIEIIVRHRDDHDLVLEIRPSRVTGIAGKFIGFRGVAFDTTRRKRAEEDLKRANRQLNLLGSITRHDLLNKITVILGNLKLAERKCTAPEQEEQLRKIRSATAAIKSQIEFTTIYQKLGTHDPQWIELGSVLPFTHVPPSITFHATVQGTRILADPMLERVFFNLLDNSIRHGQHVTEIRVTSRQSDENLVVMWEDNGAGIDPEEKEGIFERGVGKNTGLGLFLAREILSLTGITIRETGEPGTGARFEIAVPAGAYRIRPAQKD